MDGAATGSHEFGRALGVRRALAVAAPALLLLGGALAVGAGASVPLVDAALLTAVRAATPEVLLLAASVGGVWLGLGALPARRRPARGVRWAAAFGACLFVCQAVGSLSLPGAAAALGVLGAGSAAIGLASMRQRAARAQRLGVPGPPSLTALLCAPVAGLLVFAALMPPGLCWTSEANGYDVLSYHLPLPAAWIERGRIEPLEHNVYAFLPGFVEGLYAVVGWWASAFGAEVVGRGDGGPVYAAQLAHASMAVCAAFAIAGLIRRGGGRDRWSPAIGAACFLAAPWVVVTGSMAYNEMGVSLLTAGGVAAATGVRSGVVARGLLVGGLLGVATGCKPTALFMAAPTAGLVLLRYTPRRAWPVALGAACAGGLFALAPWLVRNAVWSGNPVFPYATGLFGEAHWTAGQVERWHAAHQPEGSLLDRLGLLASSARGALHAQWGWGLFFVLAAAGGAAGLCGRATRRLALPLVVGLGLQAGAWLVVGHQQSRFLLPTAAPGAVLIGLGAASMGSGRLGAAARAVGGAGGAALLVLSVRLLLQQAGGAPGAAWLAGPSWLNGRSVEAELDRLGGAARIARYAELPSTAAVNHVLRGRDAVLLLVGDATPLYFRPDGFRVIHHTTWDRWPLGDALRSADGDVWRALETLREGGVTHLLLSPGEVRRLARSGYSDPDVTPEAVGAIGRVFEGALLPLDGGRRGLVQLGGAAAR